MAQMWSDKYDPELEAGPTPRRGRLRLWLSMWWPALFLFLAALVAVPVFGAELVGLFAAMAVAAPTGIAVSRLMMWRNRRRGCEFCGSKARATLVTFTEADFLVEQHDVQAYDPIAGNLRFPVPLGASFVTIRQRPRKPRHWVKA
jgi:hypothetical protein